MTKRSVEDIAPRSSKCPHCGSELVDCRLSAYRPVQKRCPICRCRWRQDGKHVIAGRHCPLQQWMPLAL